MPKAAMRALSWVMLVAFLLSVIVNLNDPDPLLWAATYGVAAIACVLDLRGSGYWLPPAAVGLCALIWSATIAPEVLGRVPFGSMFGAWEMENVGIERSREMYGLLIIAAWMAVLTVRARRRGRNGSGSAGSA